MNFGAEWLWEGWLRDDLPVGAAQLLGLPAVGAA